MAEAPFGLQVGPLENPVAPDLPFSPTAPVELDEVARLDVVYRNVVDLPVSPDELFDIFEDPVSWTRWAIGIGEVEWTSDKPFGVGTTRTVRFWGGMEVYETFMGWERGRCMAFFFTGITQDVWWRFCERYDVEPTPDGSRLTWSVAYTPRGVFAKIHFLVQPVMAVAFKLFLVRLRRYCRRGAKRKL